MAIRMTKETKEDFLELVRSRWPEAEDIEEQHNAYTDTWHCAVTVNPHTGRRILGGYKHSKEYALSSLMDAFSDLVMRIPTPQHEALADLIDDIVWEETDGHRCVDRVIDAVRRIPTE